MKQEILKDIPPESVDEVENNYKDIGCKTERIPQEDGNYTIIADCPDN